MADLFEENWKVIILTNGVLKYIKSMRIGQAIKIIITRKIFTMSKLIF